MDDLVNFEYTPFIPQGTVLKRYQNWWVTNMEIYLVIPPLNLLTVLDVTKPKGAGIVTSSTVSAVAQATAQSAPPASISPRVTRAASKKGIYPCPFSFCLFIMHFALSLILLLWRWPE